MKADALLDSNLLIAMLAEAHDHHALSPDLPIGERRSEYAVAAYSHAEACSTLNQRVKRAQYRFTAEEVWAALESVRAVTVLIGLKLAQPFDAVRAFVQGDRSPRSGDRHLECRPHAGPISFADYRDTQGRWKRSRSLGNVA
ncbi:hypothetical protein HHL08_09115 [Sphingobium sp. AR-3-1]|uniref:PIN domain-containing protein n=1 Tax=Sphingobium psychrophilum TaxID=2728834 RepID=A0A7X9WUT0_9SPHN|nr:hypothetical protein [Sphingobium psychrophilum]NML10307.1 hypothetical protein [Sphingobium psychrophilum]